MDTRTDLRAMDLAAMDAAARDMGIVPGDTAYAFFMGMRRMLQEQHALLDKAAELAAGSVSAQAARELPMAIRLATFREHRVVASVSAAVAVVLLIAAFGAGYYFHGDQQLVAGVSVGQQECHDQPGGGTICFIPVWSKLPPTSGR